MLRDQHGNETSGKDWFMSEHLLQQYPAWREAIKIFMADGFAAGDVVSFEWLYEHFLIARPIGTTSLADAQKAELQFLSQFKSFEDALLTEHQIALSNVRGVGYRIVPAAEQTRWADPVASLIRSGRHCIWRSCAICGFASPAAPMARWRRCTSAREPMVEPARSRAINTACRAVTRAMQGNTRSGN